MSNARKILLIVLGALSAIMVVAQLVMGLLIYRSPRILAAHKHSGYLTVAVMLVYIFLSLVTIAGQPSADRRSS